MSEEEKTCFVIQPFEEPYNGRYDRIYKLAIEGAGFIAYRVDEDKGASVITQKIEEEIRNAHICFADISEDNPNVWYEVGFAFACGKQVVIVCDKERREMNKLPFDIKVKRVIPYAAVDNNKHACSGFKQEIAEEIKAKAANVAPVAAAAAAAAVGDDDLTEIEVEVLEEMMYSFSDHGLVSKVPLLFDAEEVAKFIIREQSLHEASFSDEHVNKRTVNLAIHTLVDKRYILYEGEAESIKYSPTKKAIEWYRARQRRGR
ncbi:MAG: hypothetical protein ACR2QC_00015 [Gammaproteobacteria bacterium]